jgi:hypothetical protein
MTFLFNKYVFFRNGSLKVTRQHNEICRFMPVLFDLILCLDGLVFLNVYSVMFCLMR